jgi:hypothetical protein
VHGRVCRDVMGLRARLRWSPVVGVVSDRKHIESPSQRPYEVGAMIGGSR